MNRNIFAIDHGNYSIKTTKVTFPCGLSKEKYEPYDDANYIFYNDAYYTLRPFSQEYLKDKTVNENYLIYTLFGACKQHFEYGALNFNAPITLAIGLPPDHLQTRKQNYIDYFKKAMGGKGIDFRYGKKKIHLTVDEVKVYPQGHAAAYAYSPKVNKSGEKIVKNRLLNQVEDYTICDIGGITVDIIPFVGRKRSSNGTKTVELGINTLIGKILRNVELNTSIYLNYHQIEKYLLNKTASKKVAINIPDECIETIEETIDIHVNDILSVLSQEIGDLRAATVIFMGGGSILLKPYILNALVTNKEFVDFIEEDKANAIGYEMIARDQLKVKGGN